MVHVEYVCLTMEFDQSELCDKKGRCRRLLVNRKENYLGRQEERPRKVREREKTTALCRDKRKRKIVSRGSLVPGDKVLSFFKGVNVGLR